VLQSMMSTPTAFSRWASTTLCSISHPARSTAEMRTDKGLSSGQQRLVSAATSMAKRMRFSSEPPYSSVRWFATGERNWWIR